MTRNLPFVDLDAVQAELGAELEAAILSVIRGHQFIGGPAVAEFEQAFAEYLGAGHAVGVANGTDALELALRALEVGPGDEVLVPANTFIATAGAVVRAGATPRFVDVDPFTGLIDAERCEARLTPRTRAIIPVHLYGRVVDMKALLELAERHGLLVVEDTAQAQGARRDGRAAATFGHIGCFSFYPGKNLGAFGDAGALVTDDAHLAQQLRLLREHGRRDHRTHARVGFNSRLDPLQAAVLTIKLRHLDRWNAQRRQVAAWYRELLPEAILDGTTEDPAADVHHLFPVLVDDRDALALELAAAGVQSGVHYAQAIPQTDAFAGAPGSFPVAERRARLQLSLPIHPHLSRDDAGYIAGVVQSFLQAKAA
jgi:dTDP-4-amino-4,6-dideoxygalactose transaminase